MTLAKCLLLVLAVLVLAATNTPAQRGPGDPAATARIVAAANAFLDTLDAPKRARAKIDLNAKTRTIWSNLPAGMAMQVGATDRNGVKLGDMTPAEEKSALALLSTTLSAEGYEKAIAIVDADEALERVSAPTRKPGATMRFGRAVLRGFRNNSGLPVESLFLPFNGWLLPELVRC